MLSSDSGHYRQAYEGFQDAWGSSVPALAPASARADAADAVVAFGSRATLREWPNATVVVSCLSPGSEGRGAGATRVEMMPEPEALAARLKRLMPGLKVLRVLWSSPEQRAEVDDLAVAAERAGFRVSSDRVRDPARLPAEIRALGKGPDALWLMPDPSLVNAANFAALKEYAAAERVPFFAPTEGLAKMGATATLAVPFRDLGRAAAEALKDRLAGGAARDHYHSNRIVVSVGAASARAAGLTLGPDSGVDEALP